MMSGITLANGLDPVNGLDGIKLGNRKTFAPAK
jgi:hypothetical protein